MNGSTSTSRPARQAGWLAAGATAAALAQLAGGLLFLGQRMTVAEPPALSATAGVILVAAALVQLRVLWQAFRAMNPRRRWLPVRQQVLLRSMAVVFVLCYASGLMVGGAAGLRVLCMLLSLAATGALVLLTASPERVAPLRRLAQQRETRWAGAALYWMLLTPLVAELALSGYALALNDPIAQQLETAKRKLPPGLELAGQRVNQLGYWDQEFRRVVPPGTFRVAVVGDELTLSGDVETNFLRQLERIVPNLQVYNFGLPDAGPRAFAAQFQREVVEFRPDLVLAVVSLSRELTQSEPQGHRFGLDQLYLYQLGQLWLGGEDLGEGARLLFDESRNQQAYLQQSADQLAACRTPIDRQMHARWESFFGHLDQLAEQCREQDIALGVVASPAEFQVNSTLCKILQRRSGTPAEQLDLELPQRRLAQYVQQRELLMLDLLPYLRRSEALLFERNQPQFNAHGHTLAADVIGHWIQSHFSDLVASHQTRLR